MRKLLIILLFPIAAQSQTMIADTIYFGTAPNFTRVTFYRNQATTTIAPMTAIPTVSTKLNISDTSGMLLAYRNSINGKQPVGSYALTTSPAFTGSFGYATGQGGAVSQLTSKITGVTLNKICGQITTHNAALAAAAEIKFTVTNSTVAATDVVFTSIASGGTSGAYLISVSKVAAGSFDITISNASAGSLSEAIVINFLVLKGVNN